MKNISPLLKLIIAIKFLLCLPAMPYGFMNLFYSHMPLHLPISYDYFETKRDGLGFTFAALAILFQPFYKIVLDE